MESFEEEAEFKAEFAARLGVAFKFKEEKIELSPEKKEEWIRIAIEEEKKKQIDALSSSEGVLSVGFHIKKINPELVSKIFSPGQANLVVESILEDYEKDLMGFSKKALSSFVFNDDKNQIPLDLSKYEGVRDFVNNFIVRTSNMLDILAVTPAVKNNKTPKDFYIDFNDPNLCDICLSVIKVSELISPLISPRSGAASRYELINDFLKRYPQLIPKLENSAS